VLAGRSDRQKNLTQRRKAAKFKTIEPRINADLPAVAKAMAGKLRMGRKARPEHLDKRISQQDHKDRYLDGKMFYAAIPLFVLSA
jgi:hypothetical protein